MPWKKQVRDLAGEILQFTPEECMEIGEKEDLFRYGMDSLNCVELLIALEDRFTILFPKEECNLDNMRSLDSICRLVRKYQRKE